MDQAAEDDDAQVVDKGQEDDEKPPRDRGAVGAGDPSSGEQSRGGSEPESFDQEDDEQDFFAWDDAMSSCPQDGFYTREGIQREYERFASPTQEPREHSRKLNEEDRCTSCGAHFSEPCDPWCQVYGDEDEEDGQAEENLDELR